MNHIEFSKARDREIVRVISQGGAFTRRQLETIICPTQKASTRIIQRRLDALKEADVIKCDRKQYYEPFVYFVKKPRNIYHTLLINEVYCEFLRHKPEYYRINWDWGDTHQGYKVLDGSVYADSRIDIFTDPDRKNRQVVFLEVERSPSRRFDKVDKYTGIFRDQWKGENWAVVKNGVAYFPTILIVTDEELKLNVTPPPRFIVANTASIKADPYSLVIRKELLQ